MTKENLKGKKDNPKVSILGDSQGSVLLSEREHGIQEAQLYVVR